MKGEPIIWVCNGCGHVSHSPREVNTHQDGSGRRCNCIMQNQTTLSEYHGSKKFEQKMGPPHVPPGKRKGSLER